MIRSICASLVLLAGLAATGCWELRSSDAKKAPAQSTVLPLRPAPLVTPEQVNENNALQKAAALRSEMEEAQRDLPAGTIAEGSTASKGSR